MDKIPRNASRKEIIRAVNKLIEIRNEEAKEKINELKGKLRVIEQKNEISELFLNPQNIGLHNFDAGGENRWL